MKDTDLNPEQLAEYEALVETVSLLLATPNVTMRVQELCNNILEKYLIRMHTKWL
jgi:hypothetical protein